MRSKLLVVLLVSLGLGGCGSGSSEDASTPPPDRHAKSPVNTAYVKEADRICTGMTAESRRMGAAFQNRADLHGDPLELTTRTLFKPAIPIVESSSRKLRTLTTKTTSAKFEAFVNLYDPILALLRQRVDAGEERDRARAQELEAQIVELAYLQQRLAHAAGVRRCDVDFVRTFATPGG